MTSASKQTFGPPVRISSSVHSVASPLNSRHRSVNGSVHVPPSDSSRDTSVV